MDLTRVKYKDPGFYTENSMVLVEGKCKDKILHVSAMCHPPPEAAEKSHEFFGNVNFFGGPFESSAKSSERLLQIEESNPDAMVVILSDVWLDEHSVMEKLERLFAGYRDFPPICFVFCGNFCKKPYGKEQFDCLQKGFKALASLIVKNASLSDQSHFVFVPGLQDPVLTTVLPRPPLPNSLVQSFKNKVPHAHFTTNPCRIQYCTQEIVVFRDDLVHKMCRNTIHMPANMKEIPKHFAYSLLAQSHLTPLPLHVSPVHWAFDHCLSLYPLPNVLILGDKYDSFTEKQHGCTVINPGSFRRNGFAFKVYLPATGGVEDSMVPSE